MITTRKAWQRSWQSSWLSSSFFPLLPTLRWNYKDDSFSKVFPDTGHIVLKVAGELVSKSFSQNSNCTKPFFPPHLELLLWWAILEFTNLLTCSWNSYSHISLLEKEQKGKESNIRIMLMCPAGKRTSLENRKVFSLVTFWYLKPLFF